MLYIEYHKQLSKVKDAKKSFDKALDKKANILLKALPKANDPSKEMIKSFSNNEKTLNCLIEIEDKGIDKEIEDSKNAYGIRNYQLKLKEEELKEIVNKVLRLSKEKDYDFNNEDVMNAIYWFLYVENTKIKCIANKLHYSKESIYKKREQIIETLQNITK